MKALKDFAFSDLILAGDSPDGWFMKGTEERGLRLLPALEAVAHEELAELMAILKSRYKDQNPSLSLRVVFRSVVFRAALYHDIFYGMVFFLRRIPDSVPAFMRLGMPEHVAEWLLRPENSKGLLLLSGAQGSGKTTSAAAFIAARLQMFGGHAVTYEHPVEMPLAGRHGESGHCFQTEITSETELPAHIERSHRFASPDIVFIGEIRSKHAASEALRIALGSSRQLVVATIHGITACAALDRLLTWAREIDGAIAQHNLAQTLMGIIQQDLPYKQEQRRLDVKEFLLLDFEAQASHVRAKLRDGNLFLDDNIREQRNRVIYEGRL